jgi:hypothetical protein
MQRRIAIPHSVSSDRINAATLTEIGQFAVLMGAAANAANAAALAEFTGRRGQAE